MGDLVAALWDDHSDSLAAQCLAGGGVGVGLVRDDRVGSRPRSVPGRDGDVGQDRQQLGVITALAGGEPDRQWSAAGVNRRVGLGSYWSLGRRIPEP